MSLPPRRGGVARTWGMDAIDHEGRRLRVRRGLTIPFDEITVRTSRSGGPGGQHANTSDTRVEVVFDARASASLGPRQRAVIVERLGPVVRTVSSRHRSQRKNRDDALERLAAKLAAALVEPMSRVPTKPSRAARARRVEEKRRHGVVKRLRGAPGSD